MTQTTLIDPAGAGGFELGATFAANGWSESSSANNPWFVGVPGGGTDPGAPMAGNKAYVSNDAGATRVYSVTAPCQNYFWRDITVPAGESKIVLTFNWEQQGENSFDIVQVFTAPTTITPVGSPTHPGSGTNNVPAAIAGATYVANTSVMTGVQTLTVLLPPSLAGTTFRLIFLWKSDTSIGTQPPAAIDNISLVSSLPGNYTSVMTGAWTNPATWGTVDFPTLADNVTIAAGHTVTIDALNLGANNLTVSGTLNFNATATTMVVGSNLSVNTGGTFEVFQGTTGKRLNVAGNITNNGTIDISIGASSTTTNGILNLNGPTVQTVGGTGTYTGNVIRNVLFTNTNTTIPNINWNVNNITVLHQLNVTGARINLSGNTIQIGNSTSASPTLTAPAGTGFLNGTFSRWWTTGATGSAFTANTDPTTTTSQYPFVSATGINRSMWIRRTSSTTTGNTAGVLSIQYTDGMGLSSITPVVDGAYTINRQYNGYWTITSDGAYVYVSGTHQIATVAPNAYFPLNGNSRLMYPASVVGTHEPGTTTPGAKRFALSTAQLTGGLWYMGIDNADLPVASVANGNWNDGATWSTGMPPTCSDAVLIAHQITINTAGNVAKGVTIASGGVLTMTGGTLLVDACTPRADAQFNIGAGTFDMQGGTLTVNGTFRTLDTSTGVYKQSGGDIIVDGNNGVVAESWNSHIADFFANNVTHLQLTGGKLTVVDPPLSATTTVAAFKVFPATGLNLSSGPGWVLQFGNGTTTNNGGHTNGYLINLTNSASFKVGNLVVDVTSGGTNRHVSTSGNLPLGILNIMSGEYRTGSTHFIDGNITNNGTLTATSTITLSDWTGAAGTLANSPQQISGSGTFRNSTTTITANLTSLTMNNRGGLTLNVPLTMSGTLTMTKGIIYTSATNTLRLGTITAAGTLTGTTFDAETHIDGPFLRTYGTTTATNTFTNTHLFPTGKAGTYLPIWVSPTTTAAGTIFTSEAFDTNPGTPGPGVTNLSTKTWRALPSTTANLTNVHVQLGDAAIMASNLILQAPTASGAYSGIPTGTLYTAGTPNTLKTNPNGSPIPAANFTGFFAYGDLPPCVTPTAQPTMLMFSAVSTTTLTGMFTAASPAPSGYLVVRYATGATPANPADGVQYAVGGALGTGTVVAVGPATTFNQTGLTANTGYDYYVYSFNSIGCGGGPLYLTTSPLMGTVTTCNTPAVAPPTGLGTIARTQTTITITWTASTTPGATYEVDVASDAAFTNILQFAMPVAAAPYTIMGLMPGTTYHFRVRAFDGACYSTNVASSNGTLCAATTVPYLENIDGSLACLSVISTGTGNTWGVVAAPVTPSGMNGNTARIISSTTAATNNYFVTQAVTLTGGTSYDFKFKYGNSTASATLSLDLIYSAADPGNGGIVLGNNVLISTLSNINNTVSQTATAAFVPPSTGDYYLMLRAFGPIAGTTSTVNVDDLEVVITPQCSAANGGTISSTITGSACGATNSTTLTATGYSTGLGIGYQWQKSTDNFVSDIQDIPGATNPLNATGNFTVGSNSFRLKVTCSNGMLEGFSNVITITYSNPQIASTMPGTRCGPGTVVLGATPVNMSDDINWYANPSGGAPLGMGTSFTTPFINTTTTFYAAASSGSVTEAAGRPTYSGTDNTTGTQWGLVFDVVFSNIVLNSVDVFSVGAGGTLTVELRDNAGNLLLTSTPANYPSGTTGAPVQVTIPLGFSVPVGSGYRLVMGSMGGNLIRNSSLGGFPYTSNSGNVVVTSGYISGTSTTYYWFYNWSVTSGCEGARTPVTATVTSPPALTLSGATSTICEGATSGVVTITSNVADFDTYTWSPATGVSGNENTGYTFNPTATTTYTLTATQTSGAMCQNTATHTVTVNPAPDILSSTATPNPVNCGDDSQLNVTVASQVKEASFMESAGASLDPMTGATTIVPSSVDDAPSTSQSIGFDFVFDGVVYNNFFASPDGWIKFGGASASNQFTNDIVSTTNIPKLYPYWDDLATGSDGHVKYVVNGMAPNRILVVEWFVRIPRLPLTDPANTTFQAWLYEGTNVIEFRYGTMGSAAMTASIGLSGNTPASNFNALTAIGPAVSSTTTAVNTIAGQPASGTKYTFTPKSFTYSWSPATFLNNTMIANPQAIGVTSSVNYTVVVTDNLGCTSTAQVSLNVSGGTTYYLDADGDTFGDPNTSTQACSAPMGYVTDNTDCDDNNAAVNPGATEICNGIDDDCDGMTDEGVTTTFYADTDGDTYGDPNTSTQACSAPMGYVADNTDCNDNNANVYPGAPEICDNSIDDDCDTNVDETLITWTGAGDGVNWTDGANWSNGGAEPQACNDIVIPAGADVTVPPGANVVGRTLDVDLAAVLTVALTAILTILP